MLRLLITISALIILNSCSSEQLSISIHSPQNGTIYKQGDLVVIDFTVTDDIDITTIAYFNRDLGTGHVSGTELTGIQTEYSGQFSITAVSQPGTYDISVSATDEDLNHVVEEIVSIVIE